MTGPASTAKIVLSDAQRLDWLRLIRSERVGPATFRDLINHFGTASAALEALPDLAQKGGQAARIRVASKADAMAEFEAITAFGARLVALGEADYPDWLGTIDSPPPLLMIKGDAKILARPSIAIVGARNCSLVGRKMTTKLAQDLGALGFAIISGLARGIDAVAHQASLDTGTIGVLAGGLDKIYPKEHTDLAGEIAQIGCLISEMPLGWTARAQDFPRRNRIVSGISMATIVVEAAKKSGSLITARNAVEQNREVFAVPGSPLDPRAGGPISLLKQGAHIVTEAQDVLEVLQPIHGTSLPDALNQTITTGLEEDELQTEKGQATVLSQAERTAIIDTLSTTPADIDELIRVTGFASGQIYLVLLELDLAGRLIRHPGNKVSVTEALHL